MVRRAHLPTTAGTSPVRLTGNILCGSGVVYLAGEGRPEVGKSTYWYPLPEAAVTRAINDAQFLRSRFLIVARVAFSSFVPGSQSISASELTTRERRSDKMLGKPPIDSSASCWAIQTATSALLRIAVVLPGQLRSFTQSYSSIAAICDALTACGIRVDIFVNAFYSCANCTIADHERIVDSDRVFASKLSFDVPGWSTILAKSPLIKYAKVIPYSDAIVRAPVEALNMEHGTNHSWPELLRFIRPLPNKSWLPGRSSFCPDSQPAFRLPQFRWCGPLPTTTQVSDYYKQLNGSVEWCNTNAEGFLGPPRSEDLLWKEGITRYVQAVNEVCEETQPKCISFH